MEQSVDLDELRHLTANIRRVYHALLRSHTFVAECEQVQHMADDLLLQTGLLYLTEGQTVEREQGLAPGSAGPVASLAASYVQVQKNLVALHDALYRLATNLSQTDQWAEAQRVLKALHQLDPGYEDVTELYECSILLDEVHRARGAGQWEEVAGLLKDWLKAHPHDRSARRVVREACLRPARQALEAGQWDAVRPHLEAWLKTEKQDAEAQELLGESYYRPGKQALAAGQWETACACFEALIADQPGYRDTASLLQTAYRSLPTRTLPKVPGLEFVKIPAGSFRYGENKQSLHLDEFWISRTPVTNTQYQVFVKAMGCAAPSYWSGGQIPKGKEQHPVVYVSWNDAQAFCRWAGVSLPAERQWEKAARGADGRTYPWGEQAPDGQRCNFNNAVGDTTPVGNYPEGASPYGVLDMAGNVWEWCQDVHESGGQVLRGGALGSSEDGVRCAYRISYPVDRGPALGFRVVAPSF